MEYFWVTFCLPSVRTKLKHNLYMSCLRIKLCPVKRVWKSLTTKFHKLRRSKNQTPNPVRCISFSQALFREEPYPTKERLLVQEETQICCIRP
ncbi:unnamed protein product [Brassica rapa subsp. trilocularis]